MKKYSPLQLSLANYFRLSSELLKSSTFAKNPKTRIYSSVLLAYLAPLYWEAERKGSLKESFLYCNQSKITEKTGLTKYQIQQAVKHLDQNGYLITKQDKSFNRKAGYQIIFKGELQQATDKSQNAELIWKHYSKYFSQVANEAGVLEAVLFGHLFNELEYRSKKEQLTSEGEFFKRQMDIETLTSLTPKMQNRLLKKLSEGGWINYTSKGYPAKHYFTLLRLNELSQVYTPKGYISPAKPAPRTKKVSTGEIQELPWAKTVSTHGRKTSALMGENGKHYNYIIEKHNSSTRGKASPLPEDDFNFSFEIALCDFFPDANTSKVREFLASQNETDLEELLIAFHNNHEAKTAKSKYQKFWKLFSLRWKDFSFDNIQEQTEGGISQSQANADEYLRSIKSKRKHNQLEAAEETILRIATRAKRANAALTA